jgi:hypothetical protein
MAGQIGMSAAQVKTLAVMLAQYEEEFGAGEMSLTGQPSGNVIVALEGAPTYEVEPDGSAEEV